ncbi:MAG: hypothetical protein CMH57_06255 [Myxococcales bacterium]|nr:hypothetical protein [Myxococcales bacterium]
MARALAVRDGLGRHYPLDALYRAWTSRARTPRDLHHLRRLLEAHPELFEPHRRTAGLFRVRLEVAPRVANAQLNGRRQRRARKAIARRRASGEAMDQNTALMVARDRLALASGLHKISARTGEGVLEVAFHFPDVSGPRHADALERIASETGWRVEVRSVPHQGALSEAAIAALPAGWRPLRNPAVRVEDRRVSLVIEGGDPGHDDAREAAAAFLARTGFTLSFLTSEEEEEGDEPQGHDDPARMEINLTYEAIREVMEGAAHDILKTSLRGDHIEVAFISPQIGALYRDLLDEVEELTGWTLTIKPYADQHRIKELAKALVPPPHVRTREPRFLAADALVRIQLDDAAPTTEVAEAADRELRAQTGFGLEFYVSSEPGARP